MLPPPAFGVRPRGISMPMDCDVSMVGDPGVLNRERRAWSSGSSPSASTVVPRASGLWYSCEKRVPLTSSPAAPARKNLMSPPCEPSSFAASAAVAMAASS